MIFVLRWLASLAVAFLLFPVAFILWNGPDAQFGYLGGIVIAMFGQFFSPGHLWLIPLAAGTVLALVWHLWAHTRRRRAEERMAS